jgi:uncharacterized protein
MLIRDANTSDFAEILHLNAESVHFLSPLDQARLELLHSQAAYHRVVEQSEGIAAFLMAFREDSTYDGLNYRWFVERFERFLYVDRIVVSRKSQGQGVGNLLYADLFAFARSSGAKHVTCEYDIDPPNEMSQGFHARHGFQEVGQRSVDYARKKVSMQSSELAHEMKS